MCMVQHHANCCYGYCTIPDCHDVGLNKKVCFPVAYVLYMIGENKILNGRMLFHNTTGYRHYNRQNVLHDVYSLTFPLLVTVAHTDVYPARPQSE